ncbi:MspA family porin [Gordonia sp. (in: high G+C Gram-positive bacteria)]|uniref:MspA family porin n=1 Tax=Gordonia sp. (in: high G+C Gram-positive bacteria) TaxID=84139 RepID=UPI003C795EF5
MNKRVIRGLTATAAIAGAVVLGASTVGPASAGPLPGASKTKSFPDGSITMKLYDESAKISRAVSNISTSREVMVSGKVRVTTSGDVKGGSINAGYIVGCQVDFNGGTVGGSGGPGYTWKGSTTGRTANGGTTGGLSLGPGQAAYVPVVKAVVGEDVVNSFNFKGSTGGVVYSGERFSVDGCAGYAQARARVTVRVATPTFLGNVTMYGKPFNIG